MTAENELVKEEEPKEPAAASTADASAASADIEPAPAPAPEAVVKEEDGTSGAVTDATKANKRKERLEQNRISARESRKRKKTMIEELQRTVITLSRENKDLNDRNEQLRTQLMEIANKVSLFTAIRR